MCRDLRYRNETAELTPHGMLAACMSLCTLSTCPARVVGQRPYMRSALGTPCRFMSPCSKLHSITAMQCQILPRLCLAMQTAAGESSPFSGWSFQGLPARGRPACAARIWVQLRPQLHAASAGPAGGCWRSRWRSPAATGRPSDARAPAWPPPAPAWPCLSPAQAHLPFMLMPALLATSSQVQMAYGTSTRQQREIARMRWWHVRSLARHQSKAQRPLWL